VPLVLAIEPDPRQAATLKRVVKGQVRAELVLVDSKDAALATIATRVPDLILVTALLPPRDEDDLTRHLKALDHAAHLQTLTIPLLGSVPVEEHLGSRMFGAFRSKRRPAPIDGCDPKMFGEQIEAYLQRAAELRAEEHARELTRRENADTDQSPAGQGFSPAGASLAEQIADTAIAAQDFVAANAPIVAQGFSPALADTDQSPFGPVLADTDHPPAGQG
jgi:CheY-like chemotaxis protein